MQFSWQSIYAVSAFVPSVTATRFLIRGEVRRVTLFLSLFLSHLLTFVICLRLQGDTVSGWTVDSISVRPRNFTSGGEMEYFLSQWGSSSAAPSDPYPLFLTKEEATKVQSRGGGNETVPVYADETELVSFDIVITIHRLWQVSLLFSLSLSFSFVFGVFQWFADIVLKKYYLINIIVPVLLLVMLSLITYIIPPSSLDARVALNITLFLSLTALQVSSLGPL